MQACAQEGGIRAQGEPGERHARRRDFTAQWIRDKSELQLGATSSGEKQAAGACG
jgi:hypothetical protein